MNSLKTTLIHTGKSQLTAACQTCAVLSPLLVSAISLLGWNLIEFTEPKWPVYCNKHLPHSTLQTHAV